ncbi:hypothetical protein CLIB1423_10S03686 [[Candida] railenensis]|uniref:Uncharacterized protein n=1 Tax=[Candida] railenensis TaxID=45579 RepID=A0A9P0VZC1_9ASCO|nr:hypothetical protein CLIB1423_10S03686 [[Candida] railenensis]
MSLNAQYLNYLAKYPLLTKSVTAAVLSGLNETLASVLAKDIKTAKIKGITVKHVLSPKILTMMIYGAFIITPTSHYLYGILNTIFKGPKLSVKMKIAQIATSLCTITPILSGIFTSWISLINNYSFPSVPHKGGIQNYHRADYKQELLNMKTAVCAGLKKNYLVVLKSSVVTSLVTLSVAQNFIKPELWVVFFNVVYFVLGTVQNTKIKLSQIKQSKEDTEKKED